MPTVVYLANQFPSPVEPYVIDEIRELRKNWIHVIPTSARPAGSEKLSGALKPFAAETLYLYPPRLVLLARALWFCLTHLPLFQDLLSRVMLHGKEAASRRLRALLHTWIGVYFAFLLEGRGIDHIHVHHGYFSSWIAMVAARVLGIHYSMTLHGSDILIHRAYLDLKLKHCQFCFTISEFNRSRILEGYPQAEPAKVLLHRLGVSHSSGFIQQDADPPRHLLLLSVGRLHPVKNHQFLIRACAELKKRGSRTLCLIAGDGPEHRSLERLIHKLELSDEVGLLGHVPHEQIDGHYAMADVVVLTSRSEGIPLVLMEAMALGKIVLAPEMTGIPELVIPGETGFLYQPGSLEDFIAKVQTINHLLPRLDEMRRAARRHVAQHFSKEQNLKTFVETFLLSIATGVESHVHEDPVLQ